MIGVVLSGGQSSRMGQDKGLMKTHEKVWAKIALEKLARLSIPSFVSINEHQQQAYLKHFKNSELLVDSTDINIQGPLAGVLRAHLLRPDQDIMVLACDMLDIQYSVLEKLNKEFHALRPEAIVFQGINIEPLCAVYSAQGLEKINSQHNAGSLKNHSMHFVLDTLQTTYLLVPKDWQPFFKNFNRPEELL